MASASQGVREASDGAQLCSSGVGYEEPEQPAGLHRAKLVMVSCQDQFRPGPLDQGHQCGQVPRRNHGGLVTDDYLVLLESDTTVSSLDQELGQSLGRHARLFGEDAGGYRRRCHASDHEPC